MITSAFVFMNFALCLILAIFELKKELADRLERKKRKEEEEKKKRSLPKTRKSEASEEEKRNFEILEQIQRYDGTGILRKE